MRRVSALGILAFANFATCGLGQAIMGEEGKLSISNLAPVAFILIAAPCFLADVKTIRRPTMGLFLLFNACALLSFVLFMFRFGWTPNVAVLGFQDVEFIFVLLLVWYARRNYEEFFRVAKAGIIGCMLLAIWYGIGQSHNPGAAKLTIITFGMDDKSQAAVLFCCMSYIMLRYYDGFLARAGAAGLFGMSMMTLSRLPAVFLPVLLVTLSKRTRYGWIVATATVSVVAAALVLYGDALTTIFKALDRLTSVNAVAGDNATSAHLMLIKSALEMKFDDLMALFFGTGPGNFSKALTSFPIDIGELQALDPALVADARIGRAPMHSTPVSLLLDYNIVIFGLLVFLAMRGVRYLLKTRHNLDLLFFASLFSASMFYSLHNKPYFFLAIVTVAIATLGPLEEGAAERAALRPAPGLPPLPAG
jgi:hypothetical protein